MKIINYFKNPKKIILYLMNKEFFNWIDDETYLKIKYRLIMEKKLDLSNPKTFNEKLQWLKLYDRKQEYTQMVDKYEVRKYISKILGEEYLIPLIGVYDNPKEIDFNALPNKFVIKCTHDSGTAIICKDKNKLDIKSIKRKLKKYLKRKYYYVHREWPYKNIKPRIIIEEYIEDSIVGELRDYKIYAFNGKCNYIMLCYDRIKENTKFIYYDKNWNIQKELSTDGIKYGDSIQNIKPKNLDKMFEFASILSKEIPFVRVDFYEANEKLYFGELTFYPSAGFDTTRTNKCSEILNKSLKLEELNENNRIFNK